MKDLDYVYDKFENLILFLEAEVSIVSDCDEALEAKEALDTLHQLSKESALCEGAEVRKLYRIIDNSDMCSYNVRVGDICTLVKTCDQRLAWFRNDTWKDDGVWCLFWDMVEEVK